ncbi:hypothetical protein ANN_12665 [Periplaneta americana]|uniref:DUF4817 domain-containing protein n=1 Tax=Periplaneta americana TaxID=6978 RepID=A0ABQ8THT8_PERAM|nr:hypothetical protein ANN_12665 [Periplaneta americana]
MQYTLNQRLFLVKQYWITNSITVTQRAYQREFGVRNPPKRNTILGLVNKLETTGSLLTEKGKHRSSRLPTVVVVDVRARLEQSPKKSLRRLSQETGTHFDIGCHARIPTRNTILRWVASFRITGSTLKKKSPGRNSIALRLSEATVRSRALRLLSLGPFEGVVVITDDIQNVHLVLEYRPHFSRMARRYLDRRFPDRWIRRGGPTAWPPRSPDLNPLDFYLWGHLKSLVYSSPVPDLESLRNRIVACSEDIRNTPGVWDRVRRSMRHRCERRNITPVIKTAYNLYFGEFCKLGEQNKSWAPHICCKACYTNLLDWLNHRRSSMPFAIPVIWLEPRNHTDNCLLCMVPPLRGMTNYKKKIIVYPNIHFATRPVPHSDELPVPTPPESYSIDSEEEPCDPEPSTSTDPDFAPDVKSEHHKISQNELNDLVTDLELSKAKAELLASRFQKWNYLAENVK